MEKRLERHIKYDEKKESFVLSYPWYLKTIDTYPKFP